MLTLNELYKLLELNKQILTIERRTSRITELLTHRAIVKDLIIETLQTELKVMEYKQLSKGASYGSQD